MKAKEALAEIRKGEKRKFDQTLDLIVNLRNFDVRKESLNTFVSVPNSSPKKIGAFLTKRSKVVDTIMEIDFEKYKETKDLKKLAKKYDMFIAVAPMMGKIASKFGRVFGPLNKMPSPQAGIITSDSDEAVQAMVDKMSKMVRIRNKELALKMPIGKESMSDEKLAENISSVMASIEGKLPRGKENVKEVLIKFTMGKPVKVEY